MEKLYIYYDMDNTLCKWSEWNDKGDAKALKDMYKKGYYENLPIISNSDKALKELNDNKEKLNIEIFILSACIDSQYCKEEKIKFLEKHFNFIPKENIILVNCGENKADYIQTPMENSILVDDYKKNLKEWANKGGIVVKKRYSNKKGYKYTLNSHYEMVNIINQIRLGY